jgi:hypothetical protein
MGVGSPSGSLKFYTTKSVRVEYPLLQDIPRERFLLVWDASFMA